MTTCESFHSMHQLHLDQDYQINSITRSEQFYGNLNMDPNEQATGVNNEEQLPEMTRTRS